ncbi:uncharacterized protein N7529_006983 [Penicillium soppii]|uniref:uncharacterized protein n=1 Tax=Penicillium soppii TaxID=69789 RepID=UPI00254708BF|nr:uncharacterized protein N7529_006983 [Penicillium soppii]KAJ5865067.1 hypothetical protein N7529_006983 [Penicillium soppii]
MASINSSEEQAIAFLLVCVRSSRKGTVCHTDPNSKRYYHHISKSARKFVTEDEYPELAAGSSWVLVAAESEEDGVVVDSPSDSRV